MRIRLAVLAVLSAASIARAETAVRSLRAAAADSSSGLTLEAQSQQEAAAFTGGIPAVPRPYREDAGAPRGSGFSKSVSAVESGKKPAAGKDDGKPSVKDLKRIRAAGAVAAGAGLGLMAYAVAVSAAGPVGWAAALIFFGGLSAYLADRALKGKSALK